MIPLVPRDRRRLELALEALERRRADLIAAADSLRAVMDPRTRALADAASTAAVEICDDYTRREIAMIAGTECNPTSASVSGSVTGSFSSAAISVAPPATEEK